MRQKPTSTWTPTQAGRVDRSAFSSEHTVGGWDNLPELETQIWRNAAGHPARTWAEAEVLRIHGVTETNEFGTVNEAATIQQPAKPAKPSFWRRLIFAE